MQASADTDFLLDIPNRRGFERALERSIAYIKRYHASGALIVLDVDRLKPINDSFGHAAGDQVLKAIVSTLQGQVRSSDVIGRLGAKDFAILLQRPQFESEPQDALNRFSEVLDKFYHAHTDKTLAPEIELHLVEVPQGQLHGERTVPLLQHIAAEHP